VLISDPRKEK